jgi:hypothetical protein
MLLAACAAALLAGACSNKEAQEQPLRTVRVMKVDGAAVSQGLTFPGEVRALREPAGFPPRRQDRRAARRRRRPRQARPGAGAH